jgi:very-short-patch-repair endonuclease
VENVHVGPSYATVAGTDPVEACARRGGAATHAQLVAAGVTRRGLAKALDAGLVTRIARGVYATPTASRLVRAERMLRATRTCVTALAAYGLPYRTVDSRLHLAVPASANIAPSLRGSTGVRLHWYDGRLRDAATALGAIDTSSLCLRDVEQLAAVDAGLNRGLITRSDLARLSVTPSGRAAWLRDNCDPECQSPRETAVRIALQDAGLAVRTQVDLPGVGRVDFVVDGTVVVEIDGKSYHMDERSFWTDRRRDRVTQLGQRMALRFTGEDVTRDLSGLVATVIEGVQVERARRGLPLLELPPRPRRRWMQDRRGLWA